MASAIGKEMAKICLLETVTCRDGVALLTLIVGKSTISFYNELPLFL